jgi:two-component system sensor histidine kinase DesK
VREGTTNVIRHSRARHCAIRLTRDAGDSGDTGKPRTVRVEIADDGHASRPAGHDADARVGKTEEAETSGETGGSGLSGLAERVAAVAGADFEAGPLPDGGFRLRVSVPLGDGGREEGPLGSPARPAVTSVMPKS